jgi:hypothetical protein
MHEKKKMNVSYYIIGALLLIIKVLNVCKYPFVFYTPINIPGKQMAATLPPFGIFIESKFKGEPKSYACSILTHELVHWEQYKKMGLIAFHYNYLKGFFQSGRIHHWMEKEARQPCNQKKSTKK